MFLKRIVLCVIALLCTVSFPLATLAASSTPQTYDHYSDISYYDEISQLCIEEFLYQTGLRFMEYINLMTKLFQLDKHPHYLPENTSRYEKFSELHPEIPIGEIIAYVNVNLDLDFYYAIRPVPNPYSISALVNSNFILPANWVPYDLENVGNGHMFRAEAANYFRKMREAITEYGLSLQVISTFRSYYTQSRIHRRAVQRFGQESADRQIARPGHSEHQIGLAADILHRGGFSLLTQAEFETTEQFKWLQENAHNFGFILRYPYENTHIHGVIFEPWHWRFVGVEIATVMKEQGIILYEEFYGRYLASNVLKKVRDNLLGRAQNMTLTRKDLTADVISMKFGENNYFLISDIAHMLAGTEAEIEIYETPTIEQPEEGEIWLSMPIERIIEPNRTSTGAETNPYKEYDVETTAYTSSETKTTISARMIGPLAFYNINDLTQTLGFEFILSENNKAIIEAPERPKPPPEETIIITVETPTGEPEEAIYEEEPETETNLPLIIIGVVSTALLAVTVLAKKIRK